MNRFLIILLLGSLIAPFSYAASDCARSCCRTYNASWDADFDDCLHPAKGYDACVSQCEAAAYSHGPTTPTATNSYTYKCGSAFIIAAVCLAMFAKKM